MHRALSATYSQHAGAVDALRLRGAAGGAAGAGGRRGAAMERPERSLTPLYRAGLLAGDHRRLPE